jgi:dTDP-4-amino-4,6-dideoxygalactose transaminase
LRGGALSIGPKIVEFERQVGELTTSPHAVGVSSGTAGLHLAVIASGVGEGDVVITTPFSFVASANCVLYERGIPVFVDVDPVTGNIDPTQAVEAIQDLAAGGQAARRWLPPNSAATARAVKAVLPIHAFGQPADMDPIVEAAHECGLSVIEDACEAIGARYKDRPAGSLGDAGVFAFYPNKQMTTGEGGMMVTRHAKWADLFRSLRNQGRDTMDAWLYHQRLGYNYRLNELSAALGVAQMSRLETLLSARDRVASWYFERLRAGWRGARPGARHGRPGRSRRAVA